MAKQDYTAIGRVRINGKLYGTGAHVEADPAEVKGVEHKLRKGKPSEHLSDEERQAQIDKSVEKKNTVRDRTGEADKEAEKQAEKQADGK